MQRWSTLHGTAALIRLHVRVGRVRIPLWLVLSSGFVVASAVSVAALYSTPEEVAGYVALVGTGSNISVVNSVMNGPGFGFDDPNVGVVLVNEVAIWGALTFAFMGIFQMAAHTRAEEDSERVDALRARMVGRHAFLAAAMVSVVGLEVAAGSLVLTGLLVLGFAPAGSVALVIGFVATGVLFGSVTALTAQVFSTARAAIGSGVVALGLAYLARSIGDVGDNALSWLSPLGWVHRLRPFSGEQWWVLALFVACSAAFVVAAAAVSDRRDLNSGIVRPRLGQVHAGGWTLNPVGFVLRQQRSAMLGWSVGLAVLGVAYGVVASDVEQMFVDNPDLTRFIPLGGSPTDSYLAYTLTLHAMLAGAAAIASVLRIRSEESAGRVEPVLARPRSRVRWVTDQLAVALSTAILVLLAAGIGTGVGAAAALRDGSAVVRMVAATLSLLPVDLVLMGVCMLLVGAVPRLALASWGGLVVVVVVGLFGELFRLPAWLRGISPLHHLAAMPADPFAPRAFAAVAAIGVLALITGVWAFDRRDIPAM